MGVHFKYTESFPKHNVEAQDSMRMIHRIVENRLAEQIARKLEPVKKREAV